MRNLIVGAAAIAAFAMPAALSAQETQVAAGTEQVPAETVKAATAEAKVSVKGKDLLKDAFKAFADELGITYGTATPDGRFYSKGQSAVDAAPASPQFVKSRSMAYERAYLDAVARFMIDCYGRETTARVSEFYGNQSSDAEDSPVAKAKGLQEKIGLLAEAKLDKLFEDPYLIKTPVVRNGKQATVGYCPEVWKDWK